MHFRHYRHYVLTSPPLHLESCSAANVGRYTPKGDLIDGALFGLVISTDPEALLMVEAYKTDKGTEWRYALARMTVYALRAKLDGAEVWAVPELASQWLFDEPYYVGLFR